MAYLNSYPEERFSINRPLGRGGFADVLLAYDRTLTREVVLKQLRLDRLSDDEQEAIVNEAKLVAQTNHPNVVHVYDVIELSGRPTIVLEYVAGRSLNLALRVDDWTFQRRIQVLFDIAQAIDHLEQVGLRHGDIKPENVLLSESGRVVLTDFGMGYKTTALKDSADNTEAEPGRRRVKDDKKVPQGINDVLAYRRLMDDVVPAAERGPLFVAVRDSIREDPRQSLAKQITPLLEQTLGQETADMDIVDVEPAPRRRYLWPLAFMLIALLSFSVTRILQPQPQITRRVLLQAPTFSASQAFADDQGMQIARVVSAALEQAVFGAADLTLASGVELPADWAELQGEYTSVQDALHSIIAPQIECDARLCRLQLSYHSIGPEGSALARVYQTEPVPFVPDGTRQVFDIAQHLFYALPIAKGQARDTTAIDEADLVQYTELYSSAHRSGPDCRELLPDIDRLKSSLAGFPPLLQLGVFCGLEVMYANGSTAELEKQTADLRQYILLAKDVSPGLYGDLFKAAVEREDFAAAEQAIEDAALRNADWWSLTLWRADLLSYRGEYDEAELLYRELLQIFPSRLVLTNAAFNHYYNGEIEGAAALLEQSLALYPEDGKSLNFLGNLNLNLGNLDEAVANFQAALALRDSYMYRSNLGLAYLLLGEGSRAERIYRELLESGERDAALLLNLADALNQQNKAETAQYYYELVTDYEVEDPSPDDLMSRVQALAHLGRPEEAIAGLQALRDSFGPTPEILYTASVVYAVLDDRHSAALSIRQAVDAGFSPHWFRFPWFSALCAEISVVATLGVQGGCSTTTSAVVPH